MLYCFQKEAAHVIIREYERNIGKLKKILESANDCGSSLISDDKLINIQISESRALTAEMTKRIATAQVIVAEHKDGRVCTERTAVIFKQKQVDYMIELRQEEIDFKRRQLIALRNKKF